MIRLPSSFVVTGAHRGRGSETRNDRRVRRRHGLHAPRMVLERAPTGPEIRTQVQRLRESGVNVSVPPTVELVRVSSHRRGHSIELVPTTAGVAARAAKRALDLLGAAVGLVVIAPFALVIAATVKLDSPGPVLFRQRRIGRDGRRFGVIKFRTMVVDAEGRRPALLAHSRDPGWLHLDHDPRVTRIGRLLRRSSLDELPQLWNVLRGDMSLVGPRPLIEDEGAGVPEWAQARTEVRPGLTGPWQVMGRTKLSFEEMLVLDWAYAVTHSFWGDVRLLALTVPALLGGRGAN